MFTILLTLAVLLCPSAAKPIRAADARPAGLFLFPASGAADALTMASI